MSSSRRSSRSARSVSCRNPAWRSQSTSKNSPSASLSYVFAQPEQGSPLASATTKLSTPPPTSRLSLLEIQPLEHQSRHLDQPHSMPKSDSPVDINVQDNSELNPPSSASSTHSKDSEKPFIAPELPTIEVTHDAVKPTAVYTIDPSSSSVRSPSPQPSINSWFGSLSRTKPMKESSQMASPDTSNDAIDTTSSPGSFPNQNGPATHPHSNPARITSPKRPWFSSSSIASTSSSNPESTTSPRSSTFPSQPSQDDPSTSEDPKQNQLITPIDSLSSVDEEVPAPRSPLSTLDSQQPQPLSPPLDTSVLTSLNPTTSRFTLSLPLLGKPKVPLESVLGKSRPSEPISIATSDARLPAGVDELTPKTLPIDSKPDTPSSPEQSSDSTISDIPSRPPKPEVSTKDQPPAKWWDYTSWVTPPPVAATTASSPPSSTDAMVLPPHATTETSTQTSTGGSREPIEGPDAPNNKESLHDPTATVTPSPLATRPSQESTSEPIDALTASESAEQQQQNGNGGAGPNTGAAVGTWLNPWSWYGYTAGARAYQAPVAEDKGYDEVPAGEGANAISEDGADRNHEMEPESGNKLGAGEGVSASQEQEAQVNANEVNPIEASIASQQSGWASFFTSRVLLAKTIGPGKSSNGEEAERDELGNEIMDLDDEVDEAGQARVAEMVEEPSKAVVVAAAKSAPLSNANSASAGKEGANEDSTKESAITNPKVLVSASVPIRIEKSKNTTSSSKQGSKSNSGSTTPVPPNSPSTGVFFTKRTASPTPSKKTIPPPPPNFVLPLWEDIFHKPPRSVLLPNQGLVNQNQGVGGKLFGKTIKFVSDVLFAKDAKSVKGKDRESELDLSELGKRRQQRLLSFGHEFPKDWRLVEQRNDPGTSSRRSRGDPSRTSDARPSTAETGNIEDVLKGCKRVAIIGIHGWFPGAMMRTVLGEPTGTSGKFVNMMEQALEDFQKEFGAKLHKITKIPLEGDGTINHRAERLYTNLLSNQSWVDDLHAADAIFVVTHSQGSIVSTHLLDRLIRDKHIRTARNSVVIGAASSFPSAAGSDILPAPTRQKVCCLALCGIHLGPLRYLSNSSLLQPYIQYFESAAARELFEFQNTESEVSKAYVKSLENVLDNGTKMVYIASLNDQVVPIYSGLFTAASHPLILRAMYIDGDAYHSSDFLSNLLVLILRIMNSGISDSGLLAHLSEATAGSLNGVGHSTAYEEIKTYSMAVKYLFLTNEGNAEHPKLKIEAFNASLEQNDYEIPWALRDVIADERVVHFYSQEIADLRDAFREWSPKTTILRDLKRKLQPIQRLQSSYISTLSASKL